jgi:hypothetical protein
MEIPGQISAEIDNLRWIAVVTYRSESGPIEVDHHFEELEELSRLIEAHCNAHGVG